MLPSKHRFFGIAFLWIWVLPCLLISCRGKIPVEQRGETFRKAAVVSAMPEASQAGVDIIKKGGNAIDAAVAVSFALEVVYPSAGNIGGGGFMVLRLKNGEAATLDFREKAPAAASHDMYLDKDGNVIPDASLGGHLATGVPGTVDGMFRAHQKYGKLNWKEVLQPAIDLAEKGFAISKTTALELNEIRAELIRKNPDVDYLLKNGTWENGDTLRQPHLAETLKRIQQEGREGFYAGKTAELIVAEMQRGAGLITAEDLRQYESVWRTPIRGKYRGLDIITMPPPSSGGVALMQLLKMVEPYPLSVWGFHSAEAIHLITEAENRVYADRSRWLGDPDFFSVPVEKLLDTNYLSNRMKTFDASRATPAASIQAGGAEGKESEQTTHYSIVDAEGNAVAVTTTLNAGYGNKVFVKGAGFLLNNEMDDFSVKPGVPNLYGLVGGEANAIAANKRMLSSMTPTIIESRGQLFMVLGSPGGSTIITTVFQTILNVVDFKMTMQEAVNAPRFHSQWLPDEIQMEAGSIDSVTVRKLEKMGHRISNRGSIGRCDAIMVLADGRYETGADHRGDDAAAGW